MMVQTCLGGRSSPPLIFIRRRNRFVSFSSNFPSSSLYKAYKILTASRIWVVITLAILNYVILEQSSVMFWNTRPMLFDVTSYWRCQHSTWSRVYVTVESPSVCLSVCMSHRSPALRSTLPCIPPGSLNRVPASAGVRAGISPLSGCR